MSIVFCFFGFVREFPPTYSVDITSYKKYIYTPSVRNENTENKIDHQDLRNVFGEHTSICLYDYNKSVYIEKANRLGVPKFNQFYQQAYRIFSFFNGIRGVLSMVDQNALTDGDIIILCRIDIGI